jgi:hypothetical protein
MANVCFFYGMLDFYILFFPVITTQQRWKAVKTKITKPTFREHRTSELSTAGYTSYRFYLIT